MSTDLAAIVPELPVDRDGLHPRLFPFRTLVRGHAFAATPPDGASPEIGATVMLARERENPADVWAVALWLHADAGARWRIGYLDRGVAARIGPRLDGGLRLQARFDGWVNEPDGRWRRPLVLLLVEDDASDPGHGRTLQDRGSDDAPGRRRDDGAGLWGRPPGVSRRWRRG